MKRFYGFGFLTAACACITFFAGVLSCSNTQAPEPYLYVHDAVDSASVKVAPLSAAHSLSVSRTLVSRYGVPPNICVCANSDNSFDAGVYLSGSQQVIIARFDTSGNKTGEIMPACISGARRLLGMAKIPDDGSFVVGWAKDNAFGNLAFEYWITRFDQSGGEIFSTRIFGEQHIDTMWAKGQPGSASSGRIVFNTVTRKIGFYCGHTMKWDDGVRHQGGYIGFMDLTGSFYSANTWFFSHNFDQRLIAADSSYYALAHGDAYPRALGFSRWSDTPPSGRRLVNAEYFPIPGTTGDNTTNTQTGGIIQLPDGNFGVVFSTAVGRGSYDVCYKQITKTGTILATNWITFYKPPLFALFPRISPFGDNVLLMWEEASGYSTEVATCVVGSDGRVLSPSGKIAGITLSPWYDLVHLPNGDVVWVTSKGNDSLAVGRIEAP